MLVTARRRRLFAVFASTMGCLERASILDPSQDLQQFHRGNLSDRSTSDPREDIALEKSKDPIPGALSPVTGIFREPLTRYGFKTVCGPFFPS